MAEHRQDPAERGWGTAGLMQPPTSRATGPLGTVLLLSNVPVQGTSTAAATLDPKAHSYLGPATSCATHKSHLHSQMRTAAGKHSFG